MNKIEHPPKQLTSFLVRCRTMRKGGVRYSVRHIQSGQEVEGEDLGAILAWIEEMRQKHHRPDEEDFG